MNPDRDCCLIKFIKTDLRVLKGLGWYRQDTPVRAIFQDVLYRMTGSVKFLSVHRRLPCLYLSSLESCLPNCFWIYALII